MYLGPRSWCCTTEPHLAAQTQEHAWACTYTYTYPACERTHSCTRLYIHSLIPSLLLHVSAPAEGAAQRRRWCTRGGDGRTRGRLGLGIQALGALRLLFCHCVLARVVLRTTKEVVSCSCT